MGNRRSWPGLLLLVAALMFGACGGDDEADGGAGAGGGGGGDAEPLSIDFGISFSIVTPNWYPYSVAEELGYFTDENLEVELVTVDGSGTLTEQIAAGNIPVGAPATGAVIEAHGAGLEVIDYYSAGYLYAFGLWTLADGPIQDVSDLEGERIGITEPGGGEAAIVRAALSSAGIDPRSGAQLVPIGMGEAATADAIQSERVAAYAASRFELYALQLAGLELRELTPPEFKGLPGRGLITTPDSLESEREALARFARAYAKATLFCSEAVDECARISREIAPEIYVDTNEEGESQGSLVFEEEHATHTIPAEGELFGTHQLDTYQAFIDLLARDSDAFQPFEASELVNEDLLEEINDFDRDAVLEEARSVAG